MSGSQSHLPAQSKKSVFVGGTLYEGERFYKYCRTYGMCTNCGLVQTHRVKLKKFGMDRKLVPIDKKKKKNGKVTYEVYKGYCLQPTCYSLNQVKLILGEKTRRSSASNSSRDLRQGGLSQNVLHAEVSVRKIPEEASSIDDRSRYQSQSIDLSDGSGTASGRQFSNLFESRGAISYPTDSGNSAQSSADSTCYSPAVSDRTWSRHLNPDSSSRSRETASVALDDFVWNVPPPPIEAPRIGEKAEILRTLKDAADAQDYLDFLTTFDVQHADEQIATQAISMLRKMVAISHGSERRKYVFPRDAWIKIVRSTSEANRGCVILQEEIVVTLWYLCSLNEHYMRDVIQHDCAQIILAALEHTSPGLDALCCGALECLTRNEREGLALATREQHDSLRPDVSFDVMHERCISTAQEMVAVVAGESRGGRNLAIATLCNLSYQAASYGDLPALVTYIQDIAPDMSQFLQQLVHVLNDEGDTEIVAEDTLTLLCRLSSALCGTADASPFRPVTEMLIVCASSCLEKYSASHLQVVACSLISNLHVPNNDGSGTADVSPETIRTAVQRIQTLFHDFADESDVLISGLHALSNMLSDANNRNALVNELDSLTSAIITLSKTWQENIEVQRAACRSLAYLCSGGENSREIVISKGGVDAAMIALGNVRTDASMEVSQLQDEAFTALGTMSLSPLTAMEIMNSEIMMVCKASVRTESPPSRGLQYLIVALALTAKASLLEEGETDLTFRDITYLTLEILSHIGPGRTRAKLLGALHDMCYASEAAVDAFLSVAEGSGIDTILTLMDVSRDDRVVQIYGCALFANVYARLSFKGEFNIPIELASDEGPVVVAPHRASVVKTIRQALKHHKSNPNLCLSACLALSNIILGKSNEFSWQADEEVRLAFSGTFKEVVDIFFFHAESTSEADLLGLKESAIVLSHMLVHVSVDSELKRWSPHLIDRVVSEMLAINRNSYTLAKRCCMTLVELVSGRLDERSLSDIAGSDCAEALLKGLGYDDSQLGAGLMYVISSLLQNVFTFSGEVLKDDGILRRVVTQMGWYGESASIQAEACSVLRWSCQLSDDYVKGDVSNLGAVDRIIIAIQRHRDDVVVQERACCALAAIAPGIPIKKLLSCLETLCEETIFAFTNYRDYVGIQSAILETLASLCGRSEEVLKLVTTMGLIRHVVNSMHAHLPSEKVQNSGCTLLWILATHGDKKIEIGQCGGIHAIVAAILAHVNSPSLQKEALMALKCIAREPENKEAMALWDATTAIRLSMWANMNDPSVLSIGLSALNNFAVNLEAKEVLPITEELLQCILTSMNQHANDAEVQKKSCFLLKSYTFNPTTLLMMRAKYEQLAELLMVASSMFPEECEVRCQQIMRKVEG